MYMKLLLSLALAGSALATPTRVEVRDTQVYERDLPAITNALASINAASTALDTAVKAFSGAGDIPALTSAGSALLSAINTANSQIAASAQLSITDAIGLQSAAGGLTDGANTLVNDIIAKKSAFDAVCASGAVLAQLNQQKTAAGTLAQTIVSKVPDALQSIAQSQSGGVTDAINKGIAAYQGSPSSCAVSSSAAASTTAAPSSAPAASTPAAGATSATSASAVSSAPASSVSAPASKVSSGVASGTGKATPTPSSSGVSIVPFTGAAPPASRATGLVGVAAIMAAVAIAI